MFVKKDFVLLNDIAFVALFFYLIGAFFQASTFICPSNRLKWWVLGFGFIAVCLHALLLHVWIDIAPGQNLNFFNLFSLMTWLIALFVLVVATQKPIELLTLIIFPLNALSIGFILLFPKQAVINTLAHPDTLFHILLSVFRFVFYVLRDYARYYWDCKNTAYVIKKCPN